MKTRPFKWRSGDDGGQQPGDRWLARIPQGLGTKEQLFAAYKRGLHLPDYFGENWDALYDMLSDLSWLPARGVTIEHEDLPLRGTADERVYVQLLSDAVQNWEDEAKLEVAFPAELRGAVEG